LHCVAVQWVLRDGGAHGVVPSGEEACVFWGAGDDLEDVAVETGKLVRRWTRGAAEEGGKETHCQGCPPVS
jgi:hypothetical protein